MESAEEGTLSLPDCARKAAIVFASEVAHCHWISSSTRRQQSASRPPSHVVASGGTDLSEERSGIHFRATATAASLRAGDAAICVTSAAAAERSLSAAPVITL